MSSSKVVEVKGKDKGERKATCTCRVDRRKVNRKLFTLLKCSHFIYNVIKLNHNVLKLLN